MIFWGRAEPATHQAADKISSKLDWKWSKCALGCEQMELQLVRAPCRRKGECGPSPAVTCGHLQDGNTFLPSAVAVVEGTQNKALPSWCYLVSHTLL